MAKKLAQIVSTQAFSPVSDVKGGIVITRGLRAGEQVVSSGPDRLHDGAPVKVAV